MWTGRGGRAVRGCAHALRKRAVACLLLLFAGSLCTVGIISSGYCIVLMQWWLTGDDPGLIIDKEGSKPGERAEIN
ncbi:unnamed protein product [Colias eurytheme]|nr:unnamed protein product [Colias eurytheme]